MTAVGSSFFFSWEVSLMEWLQTQLGEMGTAVFSFFSVFGEEMLMIVLLGFVYWSYDKRLGKTMGLSVICGLAWNTMIKNVVLRRRPYFDHEGIRILRPVQPEADVYDIAAQGYSFPSGHSTNAATLFGSLAANQRKKWLIAVAIVIPLLTGISRFVVGAHYPTDVLAGWALGAVCVMIIPVLERKIKSTPLLYGILLLTVLPGFFYCKSEDYFVSVGLLIGFMGGTLFEDRLVRFEKTRSPLWMALRVVGGLAVYFAVNTLLKLPFPKEFLAGGSMGAMLVRCARYAVVSFVLFGIYPMAFRLEAKVH